MFIFFRMFQSKKGAYRANPCGPLSNLSLACDLVKNKEAPSEDERQCLNYCDSKSLLNAERRSKIVDLLWMGMEDSHGAAEGNDAMNISNVCKVPNEEKPAFNCFNRIFNDRGICFKTDKGGIIEVSELKHGWILCFHRQGGSQDQGNWSKELVSVHGRLWRIHYGVSLLAKRVRGCKRIPSTWENTDQRWPSQALWCPAEPIQLLHRRPRAGGGFLSEESVWYRRTVVKKLGNYQSKYSNYRIFGCGHPCTIDLHSGGHWGVQESCSGEKKLLLSKWEDPELLSDLLRGQLLSRVCMGGGQWEMWLRSMVSIQAFPR